MWRLLLFTVSACLLVELLPLCVSCFFFLSLFLLLWLVLLSVSSSMLCRMCLAGMWTKVVSSSSSTPPALTDGARGVFISGTVRSDSVSFTSVRFRFGTKPFHGCLMGISMPSVQ